jgi:asparagine synthase (glutamine-hydrolysing)
MLAKLRGMFGFALLDTRRRELLLARDHFGQKPLYYTHQPGRFAFGSELKSLLALPWVDRERDSEAFLDYISWLSLPAPRTHFRHIRKLQAGSAITLSLDDPNAVAPAKYWRYELTQEPDLTSLDAAAEELDRTLRDSVQMHLRADVPVGVLLSSGLDSRAVVAYAQELQGGKVQTFTVGFGTEDSELQGAAETAREIRSDHHALELTSENFANDLERVAWHLDEPVGDPAAFAVLRVCELARQHVKVLLSGEGSDELFAGYDGRYLGMLETLHRSDKLRRWAPLLPQASAAGAPSRWQRLRDRAHHSRGSEAVTLRMEGLPGDVRQPRVLSEAQLHRLRSRAAPLAEQTYRPQRDMLSELLTLDLDWQLAESLLQKADKMSMGASIELRTPILDLRIAELAARMASPLKLPPGGPGKLVLRHCLARKLNEPLNRPKRGFPVPLVKWFTGPLREPLEAALFARDSALSQHLEQPLLRSAWDDFLAGKWEGARVLYSLWLYEVWHRRIEA